MPSFLGCVGGLRARKAARSLITWACTSFTASSAQLFELTCAFTCSSSCRSARCVSRSSFSCRSMSAVARVASAMATCRSCCAAMAWNLAACDCGCGCFCCSGSSTCSCAFGCAWGCGRSCGGCHSRGAPTSCAASAATAAAASVAAAPARTGAASRVAAGTADGSPKECRLEEGAQAPQLPEVSSGTGLMPVLAGMAGGLQRSSGASPGP
mmetsp:Transcript_74105/g.239619  ORF Transcript_74105/g.239619 Transcript_74105/m.239619 type:complete len:211 (-) Transcript_74105:378-1010(-)